LQTRNVLDKDSFVGTTRSHAAQKMLEALRTAGLKLTPQRLAIVDAFADDPSHPTAQEIFERLRALLPTMSFATVYSTLDTLAAEELCTVRALTPGPARFDPNVTPHHHAVCDRCGAMRDVVPRSRSKPPRSTLDGFQVHAVETIYRGICAACASHSGTSPKKRESRALARRKKLSLLSSSLGSLRARSIFHPKEKESPPWPSSMEPRRIRT
jgi:Fur family peroxide stress response transcriptional regulator